MRKLESTVKSLSEELLKANGIIQKLQGEVRGLVGKVKVKNTVTVSQEKVLRETQAKLQSVEKDLQSAQKEVLGKDREVKDLKEQLEMTLQKLNESKEVLKTNENVINWLNKQLNEVQLTKKTPSAEPLDTSSGLSTLRGLRVQFYPQPSKPALSPAVATDVTPADHRVRLTVNRQFGDAAGLDPKYFSSGLDGTPVYSLSSNIIQRELPLKTKPSGTSAYFSS